MRRIGSCDEGDGRRPAGSRGPHLFWLAGRRPLHAVEASNLCSSICCVEFKRFWQINPFVITPCFTTFHAWCSILYIEHHLCSTDGKYETSGLRFFLSNISSSFRGSCRTTPPSIKGLKCDIFFMENYLYLPYCLLSASSTEAMCLTDVNCDLFLRVNIFIILSPLLQVFFFRRRSFLQTLLNIVI